MGDSEECRVLVLGAHPDDAEVFAGGLIVRHCQLGSIVRIISVTDGRSGHHEMPPAQLATRRRKEAERAGQRVGAEYFVWDFPDGSLQADIKVREEIIREIRTFQPDLVLTHRPNDYHPDHRAVGVSVQDASYMVTVPHVCPDVPALRSDPVVAYMCDLFTRPYPMQADVVVDVSKEFDLTVQMAACHESQFFEWLAYHDGVLESVPSNPAKRHEWLCERFTEFHTQRTESFRSELLDRGLGLDPHRKIEIYEISEYAGSLPEGERKKLFPKCI